MKLYDLAVKTSISFLKKKQARLYGYLVLTVVYTIASPQLTHLLGSQKTCFNGPFLDFFYLQYDGPQTTIENLAIFYLLTGKR